MMYLHYYLQIFYILLFCINVYTKFQDVRGYPDAGRWVRGYTYKDAPDICFNKCSNSAYTGVEYFVIENVVGYTNVDIVYQIDL